MYYLFHLDPNPRHYSLGFLDYPPLWFPSFHDCFPSYAEFKNSQRQCSARFYIKCLFRASLTCSLPFSPLFYSAGTGRSVILMGDSHTTASFVFLLRCCLINKNFPVQGTFSSNPRHSLHILSTHPFCSAFIRNPLCHALCLFLFIFCSFPLGKNNNNKPLEGLDIVIPRPKTVPNL